VGGLADRACRVSLWVSNGVQVLVDVLWDSLNLSVKLVFNLKHIVLVILGDEVNGQSQVSESSRTANSMQVSVTIAWEVEVDNNIDRHDINTSREQICTYETTGLSLFEVMENSVSVLLLHPRVDVEARVAQLGDLLGQQLDSLRTVAENNCLRNVELRK